MKYFIKALGYWLKCERVLFIIHYQFLEEMNPIDTNNKEIAAAQLINAALKIDFHYRI